MTLVEEVEQKKGLLVVKTHNWDLFDDLHDEEDVNSLCYMAIIEDEPLIKGQATYGQLVDITIKKVQNLFLTHDDESKERLLNNIILDLQFMEEQMSKLFKNFNTTIT